MREPVPQGFILFESLPMANIYFHQASATALVVTTVNFIPMEPFKATFEKVSEAIEAHNLRRIVFDKRSLTIFHQPSMEWYYTIWKTMLCKEKGVKAHGKILPKDDPFRQSVHNARKKILHDKGSPELQLINITYFENFQELMKGIHTT